MKFWAIKKGSGELTALCSGTKIPQRGIELTAREFRDAPRDLVAANGELKYSISGTAITARNVGTVYPIQDLRDDKKKEVDFNLRRALDESDESVNRHRDELDEEVPTSLSVDAYANLVRSRRFLREAAQAKKDAIQAETRRGALESFDTSVSVGG